MVARAACKVAFGMDLPVSDFLGTFENELIGEFGLAEQFVGLGDLEDTLSDAAETAGHRVSEAVTRGMVGAAFVNLESFIKKQTAEAAGSLIIDHTDQMRLCDDGGGGRVWVSLRNVAKWNSRLNKRRDATTPPCIQGEEFPFGTRGGKGVPLPMTSAIPGSSDNLLGGGKPVDPCTVRQVDAGGSLAVNCQDDSVGTIGVGGSPVKPPSGGCCVVS